jgi:hypothetical protein
MFTAFCRIFVIGRIFGSISCRIFVFGQNKIIRFRSISTDGVSFQFCSVCQPCMKHQLHIVPIYSTLFESSRALKSSSAGLIVKMQRVQPAAKCCTTRPPSVRLNSVKFLRRCRRHPFFSFAFGGRGNLFIHIPCIGRFFECLSVMSRKLSSLRHPPSSSRDCGGRGPQLRRRRRRKSSALSGAAAAKDRIGWPFCLEVTMKNFRTFCQHTSLHGWQYIAQPGRGEAGQGKTSTAKHVFWGLIVTLSIVIAMLFLYNNTMDFLDATVRRKRYYR